MKHLSDHEIAKLIDRCLHNEIGSELLSDGIFGERLGSQNAEEAVHYLAHFLADEDLRSSDPEYDEIMRLELAKHYSKLMSS